MYFAPDVLPIGQLLKQLHIFEIQMKILFTLYIALFIQATIMCERKMTKKDAYL